MLYGTPFVTAQVNALKKAAHTLDRDFMEIEQLQNSVRGSKDFVFNTYTRLEKRLRESFAEIRPEVKIFTPSEQVSGKTYFAISPIEGIVNFAHGCPDFAVSVAYIEKGELLSGIVFNPVRDELYFASKGNGTFREGARSHERMRVSATKELEGALIGVANGYHQERAEVSKIAAVVMEKSGNVRSSGCVAQDLAYVAAGKLDASLSLHNHISSMAAGILLVKEAGGLVRAKGAKDVRVENVAEVLSTGDLSATNFNLTQKIFEIFK